MNNSLVYKDMDDKYIRDKNRFLNSMEAKLDSERALASRQERAKKVGLVYLCQDKEKEHNAWYQLPCGHIKMISTGDFHKRVFNCYGCQVMNWEKEAEACGMEFIRKIDGEKVEYRLKKCNHTIVLPPYHVRSYKNRNCEACHIEELRLAAIQNGVEFIKKQKNEPRKAVYKFLECGHEQLLYTAHVKKGAISCHRCNSKLNKRMATKEFNKQNMTSSDEKYKKSLVAQKGRASSISKWTLEAEERGLTFLCRDLDTANVGWYKLRCGHIKHIVISNVRHALNTENIICSVCLEQSRRKAAKEKGLVLLEVLNGDKAIYRFNFCHHTQEIFISDIERHNTINCKACVVEKWKTEAIKANLLFLQKTESKKALYECQTCKAKVEIHITAVRNNEFICPSCKSN